MCMNGWFCSHISHRQLSRFGQPLKSCTVVHDSFVATATVIGSSDWRGGIALMCARVGNSV